MRFARALARQAADFVNFTPWRWPAYGWRARCLAAAYLGPV